MAFFDHFRQNRAPRKPYKALQNFESRDTALFITFCCSGSSEPTEAFCLCFRDKNGLKMAKIGIFRAIFMFLGPNSVFFLFFCCNFKLKSYNIILIKFLRNNRGSAYSIYYLQVCAKYEPSISRMVSNLAQNRHFPVEKCATFGAVRHIWRTPTKDI